jgi:1-phosphofructokinase
VFSPSPLFTVTIEDGGREGPEIHFHAGGQGVWVARMLQRLGGEPILCAPLGGEAGEVLRALIAAEGIALRAVTSAGENGGYVHDRRGGQRREVAQAPSARLSRHEQDDLYSAALVTALECGVAVLTGPAGKEVVDAHLFRRFALDAARNGVAVVADLSLEALRVLEGGVALLKVAHGELIEAGFARGDDPGELVAGMRELRRRCADAVLVSRAQEPALALVGERFFEVHPLELEELDHHGAGDSMTAALALGIHRGLSTEALLRLAAAAGALNVTRRGLGSGRREDIETLASRVEVVPIDP